MFIKSFYENNTYIQEIIVIDFVEFTCYNLQTNLQTLSTNIHHRQMAEDNETKILGNEATRQLKNVFAQKSG